MDRPSLFWPISRKILRDKKLNSSEVHRLRSRMTFQFLFGGRLIIRDSDYLNSLALRRAVARTVSSSGNSAHDNYFREVLDHKLLVIARRREMALGEVAVDLAKRRGARSPFVPSLYYKPNAIDIKYLDGDNFLGDRATTYSHKSAAEYYATTLLALLANPLEGVDDNFRIRLRQQIEQHVSNNGGTMDWAYLSLKGDVWKHFSKEEKNKYENYVYMLLGQAPSVGCLPTLLGVNAIYSEDVADAMKLLQGSNGGKNTVSDCQRIRLPSGGFSFANYADALHYLSVDDLLSSDIIQGYQRFRAGCARAIECRSIAVLGDAILEYTDVIDEKIKIKMYSGPIRDIDVELRERAGQVTSLGINAVLGIGGESIWSLLQFLVTGDSPRQRLAKRAIERVIKLDGQSKRRLEQKSSKFRGEIVIDGEDAGLDIREINCNECGDVFVSDKGNMYK